ncbi:MAG: hypothetical protein JNL70_14965 [Saprospiraceae bacterium]|nr:hypothetical protein [Saprospiraceae bacterium]
MNKRNTFWAVMLLLSVCFTFSCNKEASEPAVTIAAPLVDDQFSNGQVITIKGEASDDENLHSLSIKITDDKTGAVLFSETPSVHDLKTYTFNTSWTSKVNDWTDATVTVTAVNHDDLTTIKTVKIKIWL